MAKKKTKKVTRVMAMATTTTATATGNAVLDKLLALGQQVADAIAKSQGKANVDWDQLLGDVGIKKLLAGLTRPDITAAAADIEAKRVALLAGRDESALTTDELDGYAALGDAAVLLRASDLTAIMDANFLAYVAEHILPVLERLAPILLPLALAAI